MAVDERKERDEGEEERPGEVEAHGGWGGAGRPEP